MARTRSGAAAPEDLSAPAGPPPGSRKAKRSAKKAAKKAKTPWYKQIWQVFQMTRQTEPLIWLWMLATLVGVVAVAAAVGLWVWPGHVAYMSVLGTPVGLLGAMYLLMNRAERAAYAKIEDQEGASQAALGQIRRGWTFHSEPVAVDPRSRGMVFRGVGRAGVVLVAEGPSPVRVAKLIENEKRKVSRVAPDVPITVFETGKGPDQVPLRKLARKIQRLRPKLSKAEVSVVIGRLRAIGSASIPIPKGVDPMRARPDRKAMRGR
ncbi:MAG: DUF4191 domain-containing protein [Bifidobacteriaceae bacterium]|jgi:hypothetical protein|nr:DUF4191 domain-containing protein [Bifidobacteriaceae bacterium]